MKTSKIIISSAIFLLTIVSCQNSELDQKSPKLGTVTFKVGNVDTRTAFASAGSPNSAINWQSSDMIGIYDNVAIRDFSVTPVTGTLNTATISGQADINATDYYGIYPKSAYVSNAGGTFTFNIPTTQTATAGNFDPAANVSLAHASHGATTMQFNNVGAWLQVYTTIASINDVTHSAIYLGHSYTSAVISFQVPSTLANFSITSDVPLSGQFSKSSESPSSALTTIAGQNSVELNGTISTGQNYYVCIPPAALSGKTIKAHITASCSATRKTYNYGSDTPASTTTYTSSIVSTLKTAGKSGVDLARNKVYKMTLSGVTLTPEFYYSLAPDTNWDGAYIAVVKDGDKYYCFDNTDLYDTGGQNPTYYYQIIDVTQYYDSATNEFYIPTNASSIANKVINITINKTNGDISVDGFTGSKLYASNTDPTKFYFYINFPYEFKNGQLVGGPKYVYYDSVHNRFPQTASLPSSYQYLSLYKLNINI